MSLSDSNSPSFIHVTELAGEPEEMQLSVNSDPKSAVASRDVIVTEANRSWKLSNI